MSKEKAYELITNEYDVLETKLNRKGITISYMIQFRKTAIKNCFRILLQADLDIDFYEDVLKDIDNIFVNALKSR